MVWALPLLTKYFIILSPIALIRLFVFGVLLNSVRFSSPSLIR